MSESSESQDPQMASNENSNIDGEDTGASKRDKEIASLNRDFSNYTYDGNFCIYFKLVRSRQEAQEDIKKDTFLPDFVHQFFVDQERIFGYKKPILRLFYSASRLKRYVKFDYEDKLTRAKDGIEPDDVMKYLSPILEDMEYTQDVNHFINDVESKEEKEFRPPGDLLFEFERPYKKPHLLSRAQLEQLEQAGEGMTNGKSDNGNSSHTKETNSLNGGASSSTSSHINHDDPEEGTSRRFQIFHANSQTKGFEPFQARMQSLIMWFIESALMIDFNDNRWDFFMVFERFNPATSKDPEVMPISTEDRYYFAGYATVYRYYAYPDRTRPRVSQMILLPPYRRNGLGTALLQSIYDYYKKQPATLDITAEDPDEEFIAMRDFLDCKNCLQLSAFQPDGLRNGWSEGMAKEAQEKLRLCQRQSRKVYEILKLRCIDKNNEEEYKKYRIEIKNRLNIPHQRLKLDCDKAEKRGIDLPEDMKMQRDNLKLASVNLEMNYQELEKQYQHTIDKLNIACA